MANVETKQTFDDPRYELAARRTGMSFQRTRLSADRTLMAVIRTSLSLISLGFTVFQVFEKLHADSAGTASDFGELAVGLGILILAVGILYHIQYMLGLRWQRMTLTREGLIHGTSVYPLSYTLVVAMVLLAIGVVTFVSMVFAVGPLN